GGMRVGLQAMGIGPGARPGVLVEAARAADVAGFATLWMGEHVVLFDRYASRYPYSEGGEFPVGGDTDWLDPLVSLGFAAAVTPTIRLATGILLVPQHNPLILAKQASSLDRLSGGRFALGVGIGWLAEEFAALGVPFARPPQRTREYVEAMRQVWSADVASYRGEFVGFDAVRSAPSPPPAASPCSSAGRAAPRSNAPPPTATAGTASTWVPTRRRRRSVPSRSCYRTGAAIATASRSSSHRSPDGGRRPISPRTG